MWKKQNRFLTILLILTLLLAIVVTGFGWPGYLLGIVPISDEYNNQPGSKGISFAEGNSKAFEINPVPGMTISAEENALDKDRTFKVTEVSEKEADRVIGQYDEKFNDGGIVGDIWEIDAGLNDDESFPGTYRVTLDLEELGIPEENYENVRLYRIDDAGVWWEYATALEGSSISIDSRKNSLLAWVVIISLLPALYDETQRKASGAYLMPELKSSLRSKNIDCYDVEIDGKQDRFRIILDIASIKEKLFKASTDLQNAKDRVAAKAVYDAIKEYDFPEKVKNAILENVPSSVSASHINNAVNNSINTQKEEFDEKELPEIKRAVAAIAIKKVDELVKGEPEYLEHQSFLENLSTNAPTLESLKKAINQVNTVAGYLEKVYFYLKDVIGVTMPTGVTEVHLSDVQGTENAGVANFPIFNYARILNPKKSFIAAAVGTTEPIKDMKWEDISILGNPALVVIMERIEQKDARRYDELLLTMAHEMFHIVQREYVSSIRANYSFDEMTAQAVEVDAYHYFLGKGDISTTSMAFENLGRVQYFAVPLDAYFAFYPEGKIGFEEGWVYPVFGKGANVSYGRASFFIYLRNKFGTSYDSVLRKYKSLWGKRALTTILKTVFNDESKAIATAPEKALSLYYYHFATSKEMSDKFISKADSKEHEVFSPSLRIRDTTENIKLTAYDYSLRVRRLFVSKRKKEDKQYAIVAKRSWYTNQFGNIRTLPLNRTEGKDYVELKDGFFIKPKDYPADQGVPAEHLMEMTLDNGDKDQKLYFEYDICQLTPLEEPEMETKNGTLEIKEIQRPDYRKGFVDRVVAVIKCGKKTLKIEDKAYGGSGTIKNWKIDLSDLEIEGKPLTNKQKKALTISFRECVTGTWDKENIKNACLGPGEAFQVPLEFDITGTYNATAAITDVALSDAASKMIGGFADVVANAFGYDPSDEEVQDAINGSIEVNENAVNLTQTIVISRIKDDRYQIEIDLDQVGHLSYEGTLNDNKELHMTMKGYTPLQASGGGDNSIDATTELMDQLTLQFHQNEAGDAYIDGTCGISSSLIKANYSCSGNKIPE